MQDSPCDSDMDCTRRKFKSSYECWEIFSQFSFFSNFGMFLEHFPLQFRDIIFFFRKFSKIQIFKILNCKQFIYVFSVSSLILSLWEALVSEFDRRVFLKKWNFDFWGIFGIFRSSSGKCKILPAILIWIAHDESSKAHMSAEKIFLNFHFFRTSGCFSNIFHYNFGI